MTFPARATAVVALLLIPLALAPALADDVAPTGNPVIDRTVKIVDENFYDASALPAFHEAVRKEVAAVAPSNDAATLDRVENDILARLGASHTERFTRDEIDYYELSDIFRFALRREARRLYPPDGDVAYDGIGIASRDIGGKRFITDVYDDAPAARAGLMAGDEILSVDGQPFEEIGSFTGKAGKTAALEIRRTADGAPMTVEVPVKSIRPTETFVDAIDASARVIERDGHKIGVVHLWSYTSDAVTEVLNRAIATRFADVDGLILDIRSRWGGAPADAAELYLGGTADMTMTERDGKVRYINERFHKPVVGIIDGGTRSGAEILAYNLKKNGVPLIGQPSAGAVLAGTGYLLPDDSFLLLAVADVTIDGIRLEGNPVQPDISVPFDVRYAAGADPQMDAALTEMGRRLGATAD